MYPFKILCAFVIVPLLFNFLRFWWFHSRFASNHPRTSYFAAFREGRVFREWGSQRRRGGGTKSSLASAVCRERPSGLDARSPRARVSASFSHIIISSQNVHITDEARAYIFVYTYINIYVLPLVQQLPLLLRESTPAPPASPSGAARRLLSAADEEPSSSSVRFRCN